MQRAPCRIRVGLAVALLSGAGMAAAIGPTAPAVGDAVLTDRALASASAWEVFAQDQGTVALAEAALAGDRERMQALVRSGASVQARGRDGIRLLEWAMLRQSRDAVQALLALGADPNLPGRDGRTPLHLAAMYRQTDYLALLLRHGGKPNVRHEITQATPLFAALQANRFDNAELLMRSGADLSLSDRQGDTALHLAAAQNQFAMVLRLLQAGAPAQALSRQQVSFQRYLYMTPERLLHWPARRSLQQIEAWLQDHGVALERPAPRR